MDTRHIAILPLGLLPILFFIGYIIWIKMNEAGQKSIGSKIRNGITEYPNALSETLHGSNENELEHTDDSRSVILLLDVNFSRFARSECNGNLSPEGAKQFIKDYFYRHSDDFYCRELAEKFIIESVENSKDAQTLQIRITLPDSVIRSDKYVDHEMRHMGSVFQRNLVGNHNRYLLYRDGRNRVVREGEKTVTAQ